MTRFIGILAASAAALTAGGQPSAVAPAGSHSPGSAQDADWHQALDATAPIGYWIAPDSTEDSPTQAGDSELAHWALAAWQTAADGAFQVMPAPQDSALIRLYWAGGDARLYGEMRPFRLGERRGAAVFVLPDTRPMGREIARRARRDPLFRDTIVYLTCLHELGHALGLAHTADYDDIMYSFRNGGDVLRYFLRYRDRLRSRDDIADLAGLSDQDVARVRALYER